MGRNTWDILLVYLVIFYFNEYVSRNFIWNRKDLTGKGELTSCCEVVLNSQRGDRECHGMMVLGTWVDCVGNWLDLFSWLGCLRWGCERGWVRLLHDEGQRILKFSLPYLPGLEKSIRWNTVIKAVTLTHTGTIWNIYTRLSVVWNLWKANHPSLGSAAKVLK